MITFRHNDGTGHFGVTEAIDDCEVFAGSMEQAG
jgi:hypothetical protein